MGSSVSSGSSRHTRSALADVTFFPPLAPVFPDTDGLLGISPRTLKAGILVITHSHRIAGIARSKRLLFLGQASTVKGLFTRSPRSLNTHPSEPLLTRQPFRYGKMDAKY